MEDKVKIDGLFQKKFKDFEADPGMDSWEPIREKLLAERRRRHAIYWRWAGTAAALLFAFYSGYYFNTDRVTQPPLAPPAQNITNVEPEGHFQPAQRQHPENANREKETTKDASAYPIASQSPSENKGKEKNHLSSFPASFTGIDADKPNTDGFPRQGDIQLNIEALKVTVAQHTQRQQPLTILENNFSPSQKPILQDEEALYYYPEEGKKEKEEPFSEKLGLSAIAGPTFAFRDISVKNENKLLQQNIDNEQLENSYTAGVNIHYRAGSRWEIQAGFFVNNWEQHSENVLLKGSASSLTNTISFAEGTTSSGPVALNNVNLQSDISIVSGYSGQNVYALLPGVHQQYNFVEIPLSLGYYLLSNGRWSIKVNAGLSSRFLTGSEVNLTYADGSKVTYDGLRLNDYSLQIIGGTGFGYRLSKKLQLNLQPSVLYGVTPVTSNKEVETYFHQVLIYSGLKYSF